MIILSIFVSVSYIWKINLEQRINFIFVAHRHVTAQDKTWSYVYMLPCNSKIKIICINFPTHKFFLSSRLELTIRKILNSKKKINCNEEFGVQSYRVTNMRRGCWAIYWLCFVVYVSSEESPEGWLSVKYRVFVISKTVQVENIL